MDGTNTHGNVLPHRPLVDSQVWSHTAGSRWSGDPLCSDSGPGEWRFERFLRGERQETPITDTAVTKEPRIKSLKGTMVIKQNFSPSNSLIPGSPLLKMYLHKQCRSLPLAHFYPIFLLYLLLQPDIRCNRLLRRGLLYVFPIDFPTKKVNQRVTLKASVQTNTKTSSKFSTLWN